MHPEFPSELRKSPDLGYVAEAVFVDNRGKVLSAVFRSTVAAYEHDLNRLEGTDAGVGSWRFTPAMRGGRPVNSLIHFSVVFNPASASTTGPDATPRLLDAYAVVDPRRASTNHDSLVPQEVLWAEVSIDEMGRPTVVKGAPESLADLLDKNVKTWRFAPARRAGRAVAQDVRVPFIIVPPEIGLAKNSIPPRVIKQYRPTYPFSMRQSGMRGEVLVDFVVDIEGHARRVFVLRSLNPAFDAPAIDAVSRWTFEPGQVNGVPVFTHLQVPIFFDLNNLPDGGGDDILVRRKGDASKLPEGLRVDVPPKTVGVATPVFPYELLRDDVTGYAEVAYLVDEQGRVARSRVVKADRPEFGLALQAAVERFEYEPALKNGRPNEAVLGFERHFRTSDSNLVTSDESRLLRLEQKHPERIGRAGDVDSPIKPEIARSPMFPRSLVSSVGRGEAVVEFLIDESGQPRLPRIVSSSDPAFGYSAAQAVALWKFKPPTRKGKPIAVRVRVPFEFDAAVPSTPSRGKQ